MNFSRCFIIITAALVLLSGCSRNDGNGRPVSGKAPPEASRVPVTENESGPESDTETSQDNLPTLSDIKSIKVSTRSDNPRDGFKAEIEYDRPERENTSYLYEWKVNGEEIPGASGNELDWQEGFKKGDEISVSVTPYNSLGQGAMSAEGSFRIPNSPPVITSRPDVSFQDGKVGYQVEASDPDGDTLDYSIKNAPRGMTIEPATGLIIWEFSDKDVGEYKITVIVTDSDGARAVQELTLSVNSQGAVSDETQ